MICQWFSRSIIAKAENKFFYEGKSLKSEAICHFHERNVREISRRKKTWFHLCIEQNIICSQIKLDDIGHEHADHYSYNVAVICRSRGELLPNEKEETFATNDKNYYSSSVKNYFLTRMSCFIYLSQTREFPVECE